MKRKEARDKAQKELNKAKEEGNEEDVARMERRLVKVSKKEVEEAKKLLTLMGIPHVTVKNLHYEQVQVAEQHLFFFFYKKVITFLDCKMVHSDKVKLKSFWLFFNIQWYSLRFLSVETIASACLKLSSYKETYYQKRLLVKKNKELINWFLKFNKQTKEPTI